MGGKGRQLCVRLLNMILRMGMVGGVVFGDRGIIV